MNELTTLIIQYLVLITLTIAYFQIKNKTVSKIFAIGISIFCVLSLIYFIVFFKLIFSQFMIFMKNWIYEILVTLILMFGTYQLYKRIKRKRENKNGKR